MEIIFIGNQKLFIFLVSQTVMFMIQFGIFTRYFPYTLEETAKRIRNAGFNTVQLDMEFKDIDLTADNITKEKCNTIRDAFRRHNLPIIVFLIIIAWLILMPPNEKQIYIT